MLQEGRGCSWNSLLEGTDVEQETLSRILSKMLIIEMIVRRQSRLYELQAIAGSLHIPFGLYC
jgi:arginine repressor